MTHEEVSGFRVRGTHQCSNRSVEEGLHRRGGCIEDHGTVRGLQASSLQVHSAGAERKVQGAGPGAKGCFHRKTSRKPGIFYEAPFRFYRRIIERSGNAGPEDVSEKKGVWPESVVRFRCFTVTIVWAMRRSPRFTGCLFRRRAGR
jgi:hypothetical protein